MNRQLFTQPEGVDFTVRGSGQFPFDMLRYDQCFPVDAEAVEDIQAVGPKGRKARTVRLWTTKRNPTEGRWRSFGWSVLE